MRCRLVLSIQTTFSVCHCIYSDKNVQLSICIRTLCEYLNDLNHNSHFSSIFGCFWNFSKNFPSVVISNCCSIINYNKSTGDKQIVEKNTVKMLLVFGMNMRQSKDQQRSSSSHFVKSCIKLVWGALAYRCSIKCYVVCLRRCCFIVVCCLNKTDYCISVDECR